MYISVVADDAILAELGSDLIFKQQQCYTGKPFSHLTLLPTLAAHVRRLHANFVAFFVDRELLSVQESYSQDFCLQ